MLRGLWKLIWLEIKIFVREPLGLIGSVAIPVLVFLVLGRILSQRVGTVAPEGTAFITVRLPVLASLLISLNAVVSLVTIISIYREGGILKRLRATPLLPVTILTAHVAVKLLFTAVTLAVMLLAGRRYYPVGTDVPVIGFMLALLFSTWSILSIGFLIASLVPTARFAQPVASLVLYPMVALSGLFVPIAGLPSPWRQIARAQPLTYAVALLEGIWKRESWVAHLGDVTALVLAFACCTLISAKVFRWE